MERNGSQGSDNASTHINPKTRTNASCAPQPLQVNSAANKSWLINYVEAVLPRHIINALTSTQAALGGNVCAHIQKHTCTQCQASSHRTKIDTCIQGHRHTRNAAHRKSCVFSLRLWTSVHTYSTLTPFSFFLEIHGSLPFPEAEETRDTSWKQATTMI